MSTKLICVTPNNNNKFYNMTDLGDGTFEVEYGRVGSASVKVNYSMSQWNKKYNEKIKKGYVDISESLSQDIKKASLEIQDKDVKDLISFLMSCAKQSIKSNYEVSLENISEVQINKVQELLDELNLIIFTQPTAKYINEKLQKIYTTIPRKMHDTRAFFLRDTYTTQYLLELLQEEQNRLNTLKSQVSLNTQSTKVDSITLDTLGFDCRLATQEERDFIAANTDFRVDNQKIFRVTNHETEKVFNPNNLKTKLLYHGSRNENYLSILQTGLKIRPKGVQTTGSMFGDGIYAANKARKSIGYTSLRGSYWASGSSSKAYLTIFEFATGKEWDLLGKETYKYWMGRITDDQVKAQGCDSVFAKGGVDLRNDEYIVYNSNQCTIRYIIEINN